MLPSACKVLPASSAGITFSSNQQASTIQGHRKLGKLEVSSPGKGADAVRFTADEVSQFNTALAKSQIKGERLPQIVLQFSAVEAPVKK
jgi:hypothetical protein